MHTLGMIKWTKYGPEGDKKSSWNFYFCYCQKITRWTFNLLMFQEYLLDVSATTPMDMNYCKFIHFKYSLRSFGWEQRNSGWNFYSCHCQRICWLFTDIYWMQARAQQHQWITAMSKTCAQNISHCSMHKTYPIIIFSWTMSISLEVVKSDIGAANKKMSVSVCYQLATNNVTIIPQFPIRIPLNISKYMTRVWFAKGTLYYSVRGLLFSYCYALSWAKVEVQHRKKIPTPWSIP